jgi:methylated-DNA-protein-cysteine methyltransferase related protein
MTQVELPPTERDAFHHTVWKIARLIPPGKVCSYGQIAGYIPCPPMVTPGDYAAFRSRWVGQAMSACPPDVPWQRVINAQGKISYRPGGGEQRRRLEGEGVQFDAKERVDFKRFGWSGPDPEWLRANGLVAPDAPQQLSLI